MDINNQNLSLLYRGFQTIFQASFNETDPQYKKIVTVVPSTTSKEEYGWLGTLPGMREWVGDRVVQNLTLHDYVIRNKSFELTVGVPRENIEDDELGIFTPLFQSLGYEASVHPEELTWSLLARGFETPCYDGQNFFDHDHPVIDGDGKVQSVSNMQDGTGSPWFLLDTRRPLKPIIFQDRKKAKFVSMDDEKDPNVFMKKEYLYGVDSRCNVGFSLWQLAYGSKADLTPANYEAACAAMGAVTRDGGKPAGITPTVLVCGPGNKAAAKRILKALTIENGASNINYEDVELMVVSWLK